MQTGDCESDSDVNVDDRRCRDTGDTVPVRLKCTVADINTILQNDNIAVTRSQSHRHHHHHYHHRSPFKRYAYLQMGFQLVFAGCCYAGPTDWAEECY